VWHETAQEIAHARQPPGQPRAAAVTWTYVAVVVGGRVLHGGLALLAFLCLFAVVLPVQRRVNAVCECVDAGATARRRFQAAEYIGLAAGLALTGLALYGWFFVA